MMDEEMSNLVVKELSKRDLFEMLTRAKADVATLERECDRWRHGVPIEGDYVCPGDLRADAAETELRKIRDALGLGMPTGHALVEDVKREIAQSLTNAKRADAMEAVVWALRDRVNQKDGGCVCGSMWHPGSVVEAPYHLDGCPLIALQIVEAKHG